MRVEAAVCIVFVNIIFITRALILVDSIVNLSALLIIEQYTPSQNSRVAGPRVWQLVSLTLSGRVQVHYPARLSPPVPLPSYADSSRELDKYELACTCCG